MRIAIIDLLFSWPPHGGADVDVYHVAVELQRQGHDVCVFAPREAGGWERGQVDEEAMPFPVEILAFSVREFTEAMVSSRCREAMARFNPDVVFLTQGYFLKAPLALALATYPVISRCYAHETACHKDILRFREGVPCSRAYLETPEFCRRCALDYLGSEIRSGHHTAWTREYLAAEAWSPQYYDRFVRAMAQFAAVVVTTEHMRAQAAGWCKRVHVIPHGVDTGRFTPPSHREEHRKPVLFVPGRMEDPAKGFDVLMAAASRVAEQGVAFEVLATLPEGHPAPPWLKIAGKLDYDVMPGGYQHADICVVPSVWEEPFGIVALEAMATGLPVCASRVGGLQDIVLHGETGFLFDRGDAGQLARCLETLIEAPELRHAMGKAGRGRVLDRYQWRHIVDTCYPPLLDEVVFDR